MKFGLYTIWNALVPQVCFFSREINYKQKYKNRPDTLLLVLDSFIHKKI